MLPSHTVESFTMKQTYLVLVLEFVAVEEGAVVVGVVMEAVRRFARKVHITD